MEEVICMTKEQWEEYYIDIARREARLRQSRWDAKHKEERERRTYYCNQKILGCMWVILSLVLTLFIGDPACIVLAIPGIGIIATKKMIIVNDYYWTHGGAEQWK